MPVAVATVVLAGVAAGVFVGNRIGESPAQWRVVRSDPDSGVMVIESLHGGCEPFNRFEVDQDDAAVTITVTSRTWHLPGHGCNDFGVLKCNTVLLHRPLGSREVTGARQLRPEATDLKLGNPEACR